MLVFWLQQGSQVLHRKHLQAVHSKHFFCHLTIYIHHLAKLWVYTAHGESTLHLTSGALV